MFMYFAQATEAMCDYLFLAGSSENLGGELIDKNIMHTVATNCLQATHIHCDYPAMHLAMKSKCQ